MSQTITVTGIPDNMFYSLVFSAICLAYVSTKALTRLQRGLLAVLVVIWSMLSGATVASWVLCQVEYLRAGQAHMTTYQYWVLLVVALQTFFLVLTLGRWCQLKARPAQHRYS